MFPYTYSRKHTFINNYNNTHKNFQATYTIFEKTYIYSPEIYNNTYESSRKIEYDASKNQT